MNICIVTVYNSENSGSFLQAYALAEFLKKEGHQPYFYKRNTKNTSHSFLTVFGGAIKRVFHGKFKEAARRIKQYFSFQQSLKNFRVIDRTSTDWEKIDCCIIGSDTLWNFEVPYFRKKQDIFLGKAFPDKTVMTYAVSVGDTSLSYFQNNDSISDGIRNLAFISVRDVRTKDVVQVLTGQDSTIVLDPTFLLDIHDYYVLEKNTKQLNYILVYSFEEISQKQIQALNKVKETEGLKIITFGRFREWADYCVSADPRVFLSYIHNAKYVITDTFHGTIFSVIYHKRFVVLTDSKNKVNDILSRLGLEDRICMDDIAIIRNLKTDPAYDRTDRIIKELQEESILFLKRNIGKVKEKNDNGGK